MHRRRFSPRLTPLLLESRVCLSTDSAADSLLPDSPEFDTGNQDLSADISLAYDDSSVAADDSSAMPMLMVMAMQPTTGMISETEPIVEEMKAVMNRPERQPAMVAMPAMSSPVAMVPQAMPAMPPMIRRTSSRPIPAENEPMMREEEEPSDTGPADDKGQAEPSAGAKEPKSLQLAPELNPDLETRFENSNQLDREAGELLVALNDPWADYLESVEKILALLKIESGEVTVSAVAQELSATNT